MSGLQEVFLGQAEEGSHEVRGGAQEVLGHLRAALLGQVILVQASSVSQDVRLAEQAHVGGRHSLEISLGHVSTFLRASWQPTLGVAAHVRLGELDGAQVRPEGIPQAALGAQEALDEQLLLGVARMVLVVLEEPQLEQEELVLVGQAVLAQVPVEPGQGLLGIVLGIAVQARLAAAAREQELLGEQDKLEEPLPEQVLLEGAAQVRLAEARRAQVLLVDPATAQVLEPSVRGQVKLRAQAAGQDMPDVEPVKAFEEVLAAQMSTAHSLLGELRLGES